MTPPTGSPDGHRRPIMYPWRAAVLIAGGFVLGIVLVAKSHSIELSSSATASGVPVTSTPPSATTGSAPGGTAVPTKGPTTTTTPPKPANQVKVVVANGTSTAGAAGRIGAELSTAEGYTNYIPYDTTSPVTGSAVYYAPGYAGNAEAIVKFFQLKTSPAPISTGLPVAASALQGTGVLVVVGPDLASGTTSTSTVVKAGE